MNWKRRAANGAGVLLALVLLATPAKGGPNRWEEWRSLNSVGGLFPQIVGLQQLPVVDWLGYPTSSITNPSTGRGRVFYSTTDSLMHCLNSDGSSCFASAGGSGTVTNIATSGPITGGPITTTGTIGCATCNTSNATVSSVSFTGGLISVATPTTTPALTVAGTSGGIPYFSSASTWASSAAGTANTLMKWGGAGNPPIASSVTDNGTTVSTNEGIVGGSTIEAGASSSIGIGGRSQVYSASNGRIALNNSANSANGLTRATFGTETSGNPALCFSGTVITVCGGDGSAVGSLASPTTLAAGGFTPVGIGTPTQVYNTAQTAQSASVGATTMLANGAADRNYRFGVNIGQLAQGTTCTIAGSVAVSVVYTDAITGNAYTIIVPLDASAGTSLVASVPLSTSAPTVANVGWGVVPLRVKASSNIQYSTTYSQGTCSSGSPTYSVYPVLEAL